MSRHASCDPLGLLEQRSGPVVTLGEVDISNALRDGQVRQAVNSRGDVELTLEIAALPPQPVDYLSPLTYRSSRGRGFRANFVGHVSRAVAVGGRIELKASGASLLAEHEASVISAFGVPHYELFYVLARSAGMADDELVIEGLDKLAPEIFEVIVPMRGVVVDVDQAFAGVTLLPADQVAPRLVAMGFGEHATELEADAYAVSLQTSALGYSAEQAGLRDIDTALDWLATRLQHGLALLPDGMPQSFDRAQRRARPRRGELVVIRGLRTSRRWLRSTSPQGIGFRAALDLDDPLLQIETATLGATDRLALAAVRRACSEVEPLGRVQALWEAIECLVAGVKTPPRWAKHDLKAIKSSLPDDLPSALRTRVVKAIDDLNQTPLMARFRELIEREGLPISEAEIDLLQSVRNVRNDAVHGRPATPPAPHELDYATAIVARLVVERLVRRSSSIYAAQPSLWK